MRLLIATLRALAPLTYESTIDMGDVLFTLIDSPQRAREHSALWL